MSMNEADILHHCINFELEHEDLPRVVWDWIDRLYELAGPEAERLRRLEKYGDEEDSKVNGDEALVQEQGSKGQDKV